MARKKMIPRANIGALIRRRRKELGFSNAKKFCQSVGIDETTYSSIEAGYDFRFSTLIQTCKHLKINPKNLLQELEIY